MSGSARESSVLEGSDGSVSGEGCGLATYSRKYGVSGVRTKKRSKHGTSRGRVMFACGKGGHDSGARCGNLGDSEGSDEGQEIPGGRMRSEVGVQGGDAGNRGRSVREGNVTAEGKVSPSAGGNGESRDNPDTVGNQPPNPTRAASKPEAPNQPDGFPANPLLIQSMSKLLQAQTEMLSAQAQAVAVQGLPSLAKFSGENLDAEEDGFEKWLEAFEERAHLAGWSQAHQLYQLKVHLERTALQVFRMMPGRCIAQQSST